MPRASQGRPTSTLGARGPKAAAGSGPGPATGGGAWGSPAPAWSLNAVDDGERSHLLCLPKQTMAPLRACGFWMSTWKLQNVKKRWAVHTAFHIYSSFPQNVKLLLGVMGNDPLPWLRGNENSNILRVNFRASGYFHHNKKTQSCVAERGGRAHLLKLSRKYKRTSVRHPCQCYCFFLVRPPGNFCYLTQTHLRSSRSCFCFISWYVSPTPYFFPFSHILSKDHLCFTQR